MLIKYKYTGPVYLFDKLVVSSWGGETVAISKKKALINLAYQFKKNNNLAATARVKLSDRHIKEIEYVF